MHRLSLSVEWGEWLAGISAPSSARSCETCWEIDKGVGRFHWASSCEIKIHPDLRQVEPQGPSRIWWVPILGQSTQNRASNKYGGTGLMWNSWHTELRQLYDKPLAQKMHKISVTDPYRPEDWSTACLAGFASSSTICPVSWGQMWQLLGTQPCLFTNNLGLVWGSCLNPENALNTFQSEGMDHGFGKRKAVLLSSWATATKALNCSCVGDTVLEAKPSWDCPILALHKLMPTFESKAVVQNTKANELSGAVLISDLSLEKSILMSFPEGEQLKPVAVFTACGAQQPDLCSVAQPFHDAGWCWSGGKLKVWGFY